ncbi:MAG: hypothetical protein AB1791_00735 [Chloroflexota bacterium]
MVQFLPCLATAVKFAPNPAGKLRSLSGWVYNPVMRNVLTRLRAVPVLLLSPGLIIGGLLLLTYIVDNFWPFDVTRLDLVRDLALDRADAPALLEVAHTEIIFAFLVAALIVCTGLAIPPVLALQKRFSQATPPSLIATLRQSLWVGVWVAFCLWLQMSRTLGWAVAALVAAVLILFEMLIQVRRHAAAARG